MFQVLNLNKMFLAQKGTNRGTRFLQALVFYIAPIITNIYLSFSTPVYEINISQLFTSTFCSEFVYIMSFYIFNPRQSSFTGLLIFLLIFGAPTGVSPAEEDASSRPSLVDPEQRDLDGRMTIVRNFHLTAAMYITAVAAR